MPTLPVSKVLYLASVYVFKSSFDPSKYQEPLYFIFEYVAGVSTEDFRHPFALGDLDLTAIA